MTSRKLHQPDRLTDSGISASGRTDCQVAVVTPAGRGAIASLIVFGTAAVDTVDRLFLPASRSSSLTDQPTNRVLWGQWQAPPAEAGPGEDLVVSQRDATTVEVHCHGGRAAIERILRSLRAEGCQQVSPDQWLRAHHVDPLIAEAHLALSHAPTDRVARLLLDQCQGSLSMAIREIIQAAADRDADTTSTQLRQLLRWSPLGQRLTSSWRVVLTGPPNAGKSSLINAILGYQRALVSHTEGTTRDVLKDTTAIDGWPIELADTAGIRATTSGIEREGVSRARQQVAAADLVLLVSDLTAPWPSDYFDWIQQQQRHYLLVHNKCDLAGHDSPQHISSPDRPTGLRTSTITSDGMGHLIAEIARHLVPEIPPRGTAIPFRQHHRKALLHAKAALSRSDFAGVESVLSRLIAPAP